MLVGATALVTGASHRRSGTVCQDFADWQSFDSGATAVGILCDGAGSCAHSDLGAEALCRWAPAWLTNNSEKLWQLSDEELGREIITEARIVLGAISEEHAMQVRELASTLLVAWVRKSDEGLDCRIIHLGDGVAACLSLKGDVTVSVPTRGEFANETIFVPSKGARNTVVVTRGVADPGSGFILMSGGTAESLFLKRLQQLAPACAEMLAWLNDHDSDTVSQALELNLENTLSQKSDDDCSVELLLDQDPQARFEVELEHPDPKPKHPLQSNKDKFTGVLSGWDALISEHYQLQHSLITKSAAREAYLIQPDLPALFELLFQRIEENINPTPSTGVSNWELRQAWDYSEQNDSLEKLLEEHVVKLAAGSQKDNSLTGWYNQIPAASGYASPTSNRKNSIDLVYEIEREKEYAFIELKVCNQAGTPFYATYENLSYGFLYLLTRARHRLRDIFADSPDKPLLRAKKIQLIILAPDSYFNENEQPKSEMKQFEQAIDDALRVFAKSKEPELEMGFEFRQFSNPVSSREDIDSF